MKYYVVLYFGKYLMIWENSYVIKLSEKNM